MLNVWRLQLLVQFEVLGTMQQVSQAMNVSKSTVSQQLGALEHETGTVLFERAGRQVRLTAAGHDLASRVRPVLGQLEYIGNSLGESNGQIAGTVRVAAFSSALERIVLPAVSAVSGDHPNLRVLVDEMEPGLSLPALDSHQIDIAVVAYLGLGGNLQRYDRLVGRLGSDELRVLVPSDHPLAGRTSVRVEELSDEIWAMEGGGAYLPGYVDSLCKAAGFTPKVGGLFTSYSAMQHAVARCGMVCVLPTLAVNRCEGVTTIPLERAYRRRVFLVTRNSQQMMRSITTVADSLRTYASDVLDADDEEDIMREDTGGRTASGGLR